MSLLVVCERFGLLVDTLTANEKYALCNSENFLQQIQMQLSKKQKTFCEYLAPFLKFTSKFEHFEKKNVILIAYVYPKLQTAKEDLVRQKFENPSSRTAFHSQHVKVSQTLPQSARQNLYHIFHHSEEN